MSTDTGLKFHVLIPSFLLFPYTRESSGDLMTIVGAMYGAVLFVGINNCLTVQPIVAVERAVFYREKAAGMYSALPYAMAQVRLVPTFKSEQLNHQL